MESHIKNRVFLPLTPINPCMERVWAMEWTMESHSKDYWSFWASWLHGEGLGNGIPYQE